MIYNSCSIYYHVSCQLVTIRWRIGGRDPSTVWRGVAKFRAYNHAFLLLTYWWSLSCGKRSSGLMTWRTSDLYSRSSMPPQYSILRLYKTYLCWVCHQRISSFVVDVWFWSITGVMLNFSPYMDLNLLLFITNRRISVARFADNSIISMCVSFLIVRVWCSVGEILPVIKSGGYGVPVSIPMLCFPCPFHSLTLYFASPHQTILYIVIGCRSGERYKDRISLLYQHYVCNWGEVIVIISQFVPHMFL